MYYDANIYTRFCATDLLIWRSWPAALLLLLIPVITWAGQGPATYGDPFVRAGGGWTDGHAGQGAVEGDRGAVLAEIDAEQVAAGFSPGDEAAYQAQVEELELAAGPYANALAEPLSGLARYYRSEGDLAAAQKLYQRALHVVRINDGLISSRQVPLVREMLSTYREAGNLEELDKRYDYFFRLYGRGQPPYTDLRMRAGLEYMRWQREALRRKLDGRDNKRLLDLYYLNEELLESLDVHGPVAFAWYREAVLSQVRNLYLVQARVAPKTQEIGLVHYSPLPGGNSGGPGDQDFNKSRLETIQRTAVSSGAELLETLAARALGEGPAELAGARLELADWYQWNGSYTRAAEQYAAVVQTLREAGEADLLLEWLGRPRELPDNGAFWQPRPLKEGERRAVVRTSFDVSSRGRAQNIQVQALREEDAPLAGQLKRNLAKTRFRPRYLTGQPEAVNKLAADYEVTD